MSTLATVEQVSWVSSELAARAGNLDPETIKKVEKKDPAGLKALDQYFDNPSARALWGDLGRYVFVKWVDKFSGQSETVKQGITRFAAELRSRLAGQAGETYKAAEFTQKRADMAHRAMLAACKALAKVKRAKLPDVLALVNVNPARGESTTSAPPLVPAEAL